jgi:phycocyanobilin lyase subunit beta
MANSSLAATLIQAVEAADSSTRLLEAVQDLAAAGLVETTPNLIAALNYNNPGAAVAAVDGLILIGKPAVQPLLELIDDYNYGARAWAIRALAGIGDPRSLPILLEAAVTDFAMSVRRAAARGLGTLRWHELPIEQVAAAQAQALTALGQVAQDPEWVVRYAAMTGLEAIAVAATVTNSALVPQIIDQLTQRLTTDADLTIRTRIHWALQKLRSLGTPTPLEISDSENSNELDQIIATEWRTVIENLYLRKLAERTPPEGDPRRFQAAAASLTTQAAPWQDISTTDFDYLSKVPMRGRP